MAIIKDKFIKKGNEYNFNFLINKIANKKSNVVKKTTHFCTIILLLIVIAYGISIGSIYKANLRNILFLLLLAQYFSVASLIYIWTLKSSIFTKILGIFPMIILFLTGARAYAVLGILAVLMIRFYNQKIFSSKNLMKIALVIIIILFGSFLPRYGARISEEFDKGKLLPYLGILAGSYEFGQTSYNFNAATNNYKSDHTITALLIGSIPFLHRFDTSNQFPRRFSVDYIQTELNPGFNYGLGGTFWGESYVLGGMFGVFLNLILILILIEYLEKKIFDGNIFYPIFLITLMYVTFYLARNDIFIIISSLKNLVIFLLLYSVIIQITPRKSLMEFTS